MNHIRPRKGGERNEQRTMQGTGVNEIILFSGPPLLLLRTRQALALLANV